MGVCVRKSVYGHLSNDKYIAKGRQGVLTLHIIVHVGRAYELHARESHHSSKPNVHILGHMQAVKYPDPIGVSLSAAMTV